MVIDPLLVRPLSLAQRLILGIIPLALLGITFTNLFLYRVAQEPVLKDVQKQVDAVAETASQAAASFADARVSDLDSVAESPPIQDYYKNKEFGLQEEAKSYQSALKSHFDAIFRRTGAFRRILYLDAQGAVVARSPSGGTDPFTPGELARRLRALGRRGRILSERFPAGEGGSAAWLIGKPIFDSDGKFRGGIFMTADLAPLERSLAAMKAGENGATSLWSGSGECLLGRCAPPSGELLVSARDVGRQSWRVKTAARADDFLGPLHRIRNFAVLVSVGSGLIVVFLIWAQVRSATAPVWDLVEALRRLGEGDLSQRIPVRGADEIVRLAEGFNSMAESLQSRSLELGRSESRYRAVVDSSLDAIVGLDAQLKVVVWNQGAGRIFGYAAAEMSGVTIERLFPAGEYGKLAGLASGLGPPLNCETKGLRRCGKPLSLSLTWAHSGSGGGSEWALVIRDVTEEKALLEQLLRAEKLSLTGQLLSGVAHELNNPLTTVIGYADILAESCGRRGLPADLREDLAQISSNARRCAAIVENLLLFVRKTHASKEPVLIQGVIERSLLLLEYSLKKKDRVAVRCEIEKGLPPVLGHLQSLEQVFVNVISNACAAMAGKEGGKRIAVRVRRDGDRVSAAIEDNGAGVPLENREKIFEPFFTTRRDGTGLGLAICRQIVRDHGGAIRCGDSSLGGASILIELPIAVIAARCANVPRLLPPAAGKTALIIDDEPGLLSMMQKILAGDGQVVRAACGGREALEELEARRFDLVVCDLHLGEVGVPQILEVLSTIEPAPRFLLVTGDVSWENIPPSDPLKKLTVLFKPFTPEAFRGAVRQLFHEGLDDGVVEAGPFLED